MPFEDIEDEKTQKGSESFGKWYMELYSILEKRYMGDIEREKNLPEDRGEYNKEVSEKAENLLTKANKKNLMGRFEEAKSLVENAISMLEKDLCPGYYNTLAEAYFFIGDIDMAMKYLDFYIISDKKSRRKYFESDEFYGSGYLDRDIERRERTLKALKEGESDPYISILSRHGETATLVVFDLDGTLLKMEGYSWDYINKLLEINEEEVRNLEKKYRDDGKYKEWADAVLLSYKRYGLNKIHLDELIRRISVTPGASETISELKKRGKKIALLSGSLDYISKAFFPAGTFDYEHINRVFFDKDGYLSCWKSTFYGSDFSKSQGLYDICEENGYQIHRCVYVGDGDNDVSVAKKAGLAIAFNSKSEKLKEVSDLVVDGDLRKILEFIV